MMVVLGKSDDIAFHCNLQPAATTDLHIRTFKLSNQGAITLEDSYMEPVSMTVPDEDVATIADVNTVRVVGDVLASNTPLKFTRLVKHDNTMTLQT